MDSSVEMVEHIILDQRTYRIAKQRQQNAMHKVGDVRPTPLFKKLSSYERNIKHQENSIKILTKQICGT